MHTESKQSNEIGRRLGQKHTGRPTIKSADANQRVEDATSNPARGFSVCIIQVIHNGSRLQGAQLHCELVLQRLRLVFMCEAFEIDGKPKLRTATQFTFNADLSTHHLNQLF